MRYYFAPMEGLTDSIYRRLHHTYFGGVDRYYMPFLSPTVHRSLTHKEDRELPLADKAGFTAIPQLLTKVPEDFIWAAKVCQDRGYEEVNLNTGCPSGTVVSKGKGSGMLRDLSQLDRFLDAIFNGCTLPISVKTRLALENPEDFPKILEIFNRYPICELTVHPRVRKDFYQGSVREEWFCYAWKNSKNPLCYNGDLHNLSDIRSAESRYPGLGAVMLGRGLVSDPGMFLSGGTTSAALEAFMAALLQEYTAAFGGSRNAMFRLKENWSFLHQRFPGSEKLWKQLLKTTDVTQYKAITAEIFHNYPLK